jgi:hypothetical protein
VERRRRVPHRQERLGRQQQQKQRRRVWCPYSNLSPTSTATSAVATAAASSSTSADKNATRKLAIPHQTAVRRATGTSHHA